MIGQEKSLIQKLLTHLGAVLLFLAITLTYFSPQYQGKVLSQGDLQQFQGMSQELKEYYEKEGEPSVWTGAMFSGMPAYLIGVWGPSPNLFEYTERPVRTLGANTAGPVFTGMLMAYIMFVILGMGVIPSILGAIAFSFCSYNIIIIEAGHVTKAWTIAYIPLVLSGLFLLFRKKYLLGGICMAVGLALQIKNNHLQITYYTGLLCLIIYLGFLFTKIRDKDYKGLLKATGFLALGLVLAVSSNLSSLYSNYEMSKESIRGQSELTQPTESEKQSSGLDKEYAFRWSYGKAETVSLLVPNVHGGASSGFDDKTLVYKELTNYVNTGVIPAANANSLYQGLRQYWGDQPFTSGPVYLGAIICFLFVLGMFIIRSKMKWLLFAATVFFIFLSWGRHFELFNDWFFYNFLFYNKFRAVAMALVIPSLTILIIAVWGLKEFFVEGIDKKKRLSALYFSAGITGGICLLLWLVPSVFFDFSTVYEKQLASQLPLLFNALVSDRKELLTADALRSLIFILLTAAILLMAAKTKMDKPWKVPVFMVVITLLVLGDLWNVDRRYLSEANFAKKVAKSQQFLLSEADKMILEDKSPSYRVLNLSGGIEAAFNEANTSYYHKSIGGYHAAKLKRYQELIDYELVPEMKDIANSFQSQNIDSIQASFKDLTALNMLNMKYVIYNPGQPPIENPYHLGNAWFVSDYSFVNNADEEIAALNNLDAGKSAVIDKRFEQEVSGLRITPDSTATIQMTLYNPNRVVYKSKANSEQLAIFSEIYYANGWEAYIDGKLTPHFRADWILRAMRLPAGEHEIEFRFVPHDYYTTRTISSISSGFLILALIGSIAYPFIRKRNKAASADK